MIEALIEVRLQSVTSISDLTFDQCRHPMGPSGVEMLHIKPSEEEEVINKIVSAYSNSWPDEAELQKTVEFLRTDAGKRLLSIDKDIYPHARIFIDPFLVTKAQEFNEKFRAKQELEIPKGATIH